MKRMSAHFQETHDIADAKRLAERAAEAHRQADALRQLLGERQPLPAKT